MHSHVLYNDEIVSAEEKILRPGQLGLLAGWGIFTTLRVYDGIPFAFERHWQRLRKDARLLHIDLSQNPEEVRPGLLRLIERNGAQDATMRVCVVRSQGGFWAGPGSGRASDLIALTSRLTSWPASVPLDVAEQARHAASPFAGVKSLSWAHNLTLIETAKRNGYAEVILLNERGEVAECTSANIFATKNGVTRTPPLSSGPLPGVTRAIMLGEIEAPPVEEKVLTLDDLYEADEVFITSTTRELLPVHQILDRAIASPSPGAWPVMEQLRDSLRRYIRDYTDQAKQRLAS